MAQLTAEQWVQRTIDGLSSPKAKQNYTDGINGVTESPMEKAAAAADRYAQGTADAVSSGRYAQRLRNTPMSLWKNNSLTIGAQRFATGAQKAAEKLRRVGASVVQGQQAARAAAAALPKGGEANAVARFIAARRALRQAAGKPQD